MQFTYEAYAALLQTLTDQGYQFKNYTNWREAEKTVILRHDVDISLQKAVSMSEVEKTFCGKGVDSTYYVLVSANFYNVHSRSSRECMRRILENGSHIGLHFDETQYEIADEEALRRYVYAEAAVLSDLTGQKVASVSMHRPSERFLSSDLVFSGLINSYSGVYFKEMKYVSDSRRHWRENVDEIIAQGTYARLHLLTHPFWYRSGEEWDLPGTLREAISNASLQYYDHLNENFRDLDKEVRREEFEK